MNGGTPNGWFIVIIVDNPIKMDDNCGYPQLRKPPWFYVGFVELLQPRGGSSYLQFVFFQSINEHHEGLVGDTRDEPVMFVGL